MNLTALMEVTHLHPLQDFDGKSIELNFYQCHCGKNSSSK